MTVRYYIGRIGNGEALKKIDTNATHVPNKKDFVLFDDDDLDTYKVLYRTYIPEENVFEVFLRIATDEDF